MTRYFAEHPTELGLSVSAMAWRAGELLLMRRSDNGCWGLPGGFVEVGESVVAAVAREDRARRVHVVNLCFEAEAIVR